MMKEEVEEEPLSPTARLLQYPSIDSCIITKIGFKAEINPDVILNDLKHNVYKNSRFCRKLSANGASWIKTEVNIEDHVYVQKLDRPEMNKDGEGFIDDYVSRLTMIPLDRSRPLWDIHILNVKTSDAEAVVVVRCHHSLGDGMSLMSLLVASTQKTSDPEAFTTIPVIKRREDFLSHNLRNKGRLLRLIFTIYYGVRLIWNTIVDLVQFSATVLFLKDTKTPLEGSGGIQNNRKRLYHRTVSLDDIRLIKDALNMTINDVLLGVTQCALSRYLNGRYEVESEASTSNSNNLPGGIQLQAVVAVNLRQEIGIQPVANMLAKGSKCRWGNYNSSVIFPFSISLETDPLVNLSNTKSIMDRKKYSLAAGLLYSNSKFIMNLFGPKVGAVLYKRIVSNTLTFFSNIVGPMEKVSLHGKQIAYIALTCYGNGHSHALSMYFVSYADKITISVGVDPTVIPDPHNLCDKMEESLKAIKDALSEKRDPFGVYH